MRIYADDIRAALITAGIVGAALALASLDKAHATVIPWSVVSGQCFNPAGHALPAAAALANPHCLVAGFKPPPLPTPTPTPPPPKPPAITPTAGPPAAPPAAAPPATPSAPSTPTASAAPAAPASPSGGGTSSDTKPAHQRHAHGHRGHVHFHAGEFAAQYGAGVVVCSVAGLMISAAYKDATQHRELSLREAQTIFGACVIPILGGIIVDRMWQAHPEWVRFEKRAAR